MRPFDDIIFWMRQLSEHALFFSIGFEVEPWRSDAATIRRQFEAIRAKLAKLDADDLAEARELVRKPVQNLRRFKVEAFDELKEGKWLGWIFPNFVDHTRRELDYFVERAFEGGLSRRETMRANLKFMAEHAHFAAQLCDPPEKDLIEQALKIADEFEDLEGGCSSVNHQFLELSEKAGRDLDRYFTKEPLTEKGNSIIHPVLLDHVIREGRRYLKTVDELEED